MNAYQLKTDYESIIEEIKNYKDLYLNEKSIENSSKMGLKLLGLCRKFSQIDEDLLSYSIKNDDSTKIQGSYFSEIIQLELKRLKFKEEIQECKKSHRQIVKMNS
jgi:hypothetical protein